VTGKLEQQKWEKDGEQRSKVQINAFSVAPSLAFAQVDIRKADRKTASKPVEAPKDI
jgi:single-stranded DNA-binding protein